jgi:hypothetical protein
VFALLVRAQILAAGNVHVADRREKKPIKVEPMPVDDGDGYNERYCAYLDILGFRRLDRQAEAGRPNVRISSDAA